MLRTTREMSERQEEAGPDDPRVKELKAEIQGIKDDHAQLEKERSGIYLDATSEMSNEFKMAKGTTGIERERHESYAQRLDAVRLRTMQQHGASYLYA